MRNSLKGEETRGRKGSLWLQLKDAVLMEGRHNDKSLRQLTSAVRIREMWMLVLRSSTFNSAQVPSPWAAITHTHSGSSPLNQPNLETPHRDPRGSSRGVSKGGTWEVRAPCLASFLSLSSPYFFLRQGLSVNLELIVLSIVTDQRAPGLHPSLPS